MQDGKIKKFLNWAPRTSTSNTTSRYKEEDSEGEEERREGVNQGAAGRDRRVEGEFEDESEV